MKTLSLTAVLVAALAGNVAAADLAPACNSWDRVPAPVTGKQNALTAIDALNSENVWAIGREWSPIGLSDGSPLVVRWDGASWVAEPLPDLSHVGPNPTPEAIHVAENGDPWVVGRTRDGQGLSSPLILQSVGGHWLVHRVNMLDSFAARFGSFRDVASAGPDVAWAVGEAQTIVKGAVEPFAAYWDGSSWTEVSVPGAINRRRTLSAVSAAQPTSAWAVGYDYDETIKTASARIFHWDGHGWTEVAHPAANKPGAVLHDVVAIAADDVWAVGVIGDEEAGLFLHWDGSTWTSHVAPLGSNPRAIDGVASDDVWALGPKGLSHFDGARWTFQPHNATLAPPARVSIAVAGPCDTWTVATGDRASAIQHLTPTPAAPAPPAPVGLVAKPLSVKHVELRWQSGGDPTLPVQQTGFVVERCTGDAGQCIDRFEIIAKLAANVTAYGDASVLPGASYTYRVYAVNDSSPSAPTAPVTITTPSSEGDPTPAPDPLPANPDVRLQTTSSAVPVSDDAAPVPQSSGSTSLSVPSTNTSALATRSVALSRPQGSVPVAPTGLVAKPGVKSITLAWEPRADPNTPADTAYVIERCIGNADGCVTLQLVIAKVVGRTSFVDSGLQPGTPYTYRVYAVNESGASERSLPVTGFTLPADTSSPLPVPVATSPRQ